MYKSQFGSDEKVCSVKITGVIGLKYGFQCSLGVVDMAVGITSQKEYRPVLFTYILLIAFTHIYQILLCAKKVRRSFFLMYLLDFAGVVCEKTC